MRPCSFCAAILAAALVSAVRPGQKSLSVSHREIYDVLLAKTSGYLLTARGRTVVETRSGCGLTHTLQRSLADVTYKDGRPIRTDFVIETWESRDGRTLRFHVRNMQSGNGAETHEGTAKLIGKNGRVTFTSHDEIFVLPAGTVFPTAFSQAMLAAAVKGENLSNRTVFQGGDRKAVVTAAVKIGRRMPNGHETAADPDSLLKSAAAWPILISYFPAQQEIPASEVAATLYANGLLGSFSLIYPQYTLRARLVRVERLESSC